MTTGPRASSRAPARAPLRGLVGALAGAGLAALALASCRQTVLLDQGAGDGAASGTPDEGGTSSGDGDGGARFDGGRDGVRLPGFCQGGQIQPLLATMRVPDLVFTVDRSSAMQSLFGSGSRIQVAQQTVLALIEKYQHVVHFGYEEFPSTSSTCGMGAGCCGGDVVPPAPSTQSSIEHLMHRCDANGAGCVQSPRPLANAFDKCGATFTTFPNNYGDRYLIALVGGDPTCQGPDPTSAPCDDAAASITNLVRASVKSAIFGVGAETAGSDCLDRLALRGGGEVGATSPYYHLARTPAELATELDPLVKTMAEEACHVDIRTPPADSTEVSVLFDGKPVAIDAANGWTFDMDSTVQLTLHGAACDAMIMQAPRVEVIAGCSSPRH